MTTNEIRTKYLSYCKKNGHVVVPSSSLVPENDPTTLFTGSGMQPLLPYLLGHKHPAGVRLANSQKCFRAEDIDEVGDNRHTTFFEMLGNWSLGDYFKAQQLRWFFTFLTDELGIDPAKIYVTVFAGDQENDIARDDESVKVWKELFAQKNIEADDVFIGREEDGAVKGMQGGRIFYYDSAKNWWSRAGVPANMPAGEPGGPDSEVFYDFGTDHDKNFGERCHPNCDCGRFMEIGNSVFMEYIKNDAGGFDPLPQKNVDFGGGLERIAAAAQNDADVFTAVSSLNVIIDAVEKKTQTLYADHQHAYRVIADHARGAVLMMSDGVMPSNKEQGYVLRRLLRRSLLYLSQLTEEKNILGGLARVVAGEYVDAFPAVDQRSDAIIAAIEKEEEQFGRTLAKGLREFEKITKDLTKNDIISGKDAFVLFTTYGFPVEMTQELAAEKHFRVDMAAYEKEFAAHQEQSRVDAGTFKGGLADGSEITTMLHTCTHLMLAGLRKFVGEHVHQKGSHITVERTRFDFNHDDKVERDVLDQVETYVNEAIEKKCRVTIAQMPKEQAKEQGVEGSFWEKYPDTVTVYTIKAEDGTMYSQELCGGPHVENTGNITGTFKIAKEQSSGAGVRRVKGVLE